MAHVLTTVQKVWYAQICTNWLPKTLLYKSQLCTYPYTFCLFYRESPYPLHAFPQYSGIDGPMVGFHSFLFFQLLVELIAMAAPGWQITSMTFHTGGSKVESWVGILSTGIDTHEDG